MEEFSPNNHLGYFTFENATAIAQSSDHFPVDFDDAWQWLGFSRKDNAKQSLINAGFLEGQDFRVFLNNQENPQGGRKPEQIRLSVDCFKSWCMMANTERGKQVRQYYLECEKLIKSQLSDPKLLIEREKTERERVKSQAKLDELRLKHELKLAELEHRQNLKSSRPINNNKWTNNRTSTDRLKKILELSERVGTVSARNIQQGIWEYRSTSAQNIRSDFLKLQEMGYGQTEESGNRLKFKAVKRSHLLT